MTKIGRIQKVLGGILVMLYGIIIVIDNTEDGIRIVAFIMSLTFTLRGIQSLIYYLRMARSMVGGKLTLFRGILLLDLGALTSSMTEGQTFYIVLYIAGIHLFSAAVDLLRTVETLKMRSSEWRLQAIFCATNAFLAVMLIAGGLVMKNLQIVLYVYGAGLIYSAILNIVSAFRKTEIVYIP